MEGKQADIIQVIYNLVFHGTKLTYAAMGVGLLLAVLYFRIIFKNFSGFQEALINNSGGFFSRRVLLSPQLLFWILISVGGGFLAYYQLPDWFPQVFKR